MLRDCCLRISVDIDTIMEMEVTKALRELGINRTRVIVAHRLSTIQDADHIVVIRNGVKVEEGTHDDLLALDSGVYRELWKRQQDKRSENGVAVDVDAATTTHDGQQMYINGEDEGDGKYDEHSNVLTTPPYPGDAVR